MPTSCSLQGAQHPGLLIVWSAVVEYNWAWEVVPSRGKETAAECIPCRLVLRRTGHTSVSVRYTRYILCWIRLTTALKYSFDEAQLLCKRTRWCVGASSQEVLSVQLILVASRCKSTGSPVGAHPTGILVAHHGTRRCVHTFSRELCLYYPAFPASGRLDERAEVYMHVDVVNQSHSSGTSCT